MNRLANGLTIRSGDMKITHISEIKTELPINFKEGKKASADHFPILFFKIIFCVDESHIFDAVL